MKHYRKKDGQVLIVVAVFSGLILSSLMYSLFLRDISPPANAVTGEQMCRGGVYYLPSANGEVKCGRAANCGGVDYDTANAIDFMSVKSCWNGEHCEADRSPCEGNVPLCCHEMERTGDPMKCTFPERGFCHPRQCNAIDPNATFTCGTDRCRCGSQLITYCTTIDRDSQGNHCAANAGELIYKTLDERVGGVSTSVTPTTSAPTPTSAPLSGGIDMHIDQTAITNPYGTVDQGFGFNVPTSLDDSLTNELISKYNSWGLYLRLHNPAPEILQNGNFNRLSSSGFKWYFVFGNGTTARSFLQSYYGSFSNEAVVQLTDFDTDTFDGGAARALKSEFPQVKIHLPDTAAFDENSRKKFQKANEKTDPTIVEALGLHTNGNEGFDSIQLMYDSLFDAGEGVQGATTVSTKYHLDAKLSLARVGYNGNDAWKPAIMNGIISSSMISSVISQRTYKIASGERYAPFRYTLTKEYNQLNPQEKEVAYHFANFFRLKPGLIWPKAYAKFKGDHWENPSGRVWDVPNFANSKPFVGSAGKADGKFYGFFSNTGSSQEVLALTNAFPWGEYTVYSTTRGTGNFISNNAISLAPQETVVVYHPSLVGAVAPTGAPTATPVSNVTPTVTAAPATLKVMTYNFLCLKENTKDNTARYIANNQIDIVGLQEITKHGGVDTVKLFTDHLNSLNYPMGQINVPYHTIPKGQTEGHKRLVILYRQPRFQLIENQVLDIPDSGPDFRKVLMAYLLDTYTQKYYRVFNHHPDFGGGQCPGTRPAMDWITQFNSPNSLFMGDFNMAMKDADVVPAFSCLKTLRSEYNYTCSVPNSCNVNALDHIFSTKNGDLTLTNSFRNETDFRISGTDNDCSKDYDSDKHYPIVGEYLVQGSSVSVTPVPSATPTPGGTASCTAAAPTAVFRSPQAGIVTGESPQMQRVTVLPGIHHISWIVPAERYQGKTENEAQSYAVRVDDMADSWGGVWVNNGCQISDRVSHPNDYCIDNLDIAHPFYPSAYRFEAGHSYRIWVHTLNACGGWDESTKAVAEVSVPSITALTPTPATCDAPGSAPAMVVPGEGTKTLPVGIWPIQWTATPGADTYSVKVYDTNVSSTTPALEVGDIRGLAYPYNFIDGHVYNITVTAHAVCGAASAPVTISNITSTSVAQTTCVIQGYKALGTDSSPVANWRSYPAEVSAQEITVKDGATGIKYTSSSTVKNPYFVIVDGDKTYTVSTTEPTGYKISSEKCQVGDTFCSTKSDFKVEGASRSDIYCPKGGFMNLWFRYEATGPATPTPTPQPSSCTSCSSKVPYLCKTASTLSIASSFCLSRDVSKESTLYSCESCAAVPYARDDLFPIQRDFSVKIPKTYPPVCSSTVSVPMVNIFKNDVVDAQELQSITVDTTNLSSSGTLTDNTASCVTYTHTSDTATSFDYTLSYAKATSSANATMNVVDGVMPSCVVEGTECPIEPTPVTTCTVSSVPVWSTNLEVGESPVRRMVVYEDMSVSGGSTIENINFVLEPINEPTLEVSTDSGTEWVPVVAETDGSYVATALDVRESVVTLKIRTKSACGEVSGELETTVNPLSASGTGGVTPTPGAAVAASGLVRTLLIGGLIVGIAAVAAYMLGL